MRLKILDSGYSFGTKVLFALIHAVSRQPVPDAAKLVFYRPDFYGAPMKRRLSRRRMSARFALERTLPPRRGRITMKRKSPPCFPISRPRPLTSHCGQRCACWAS